MLVVSQPRCSRVRFLACASAMLLATWVSWAAAAEHTADSLPQVRQALESGAAVLLDVREQREWDAGHLSNARLIPLSGLPQAIQNGSLDRELPREKIIYCHCGSGRRVLTAADLLLPQGYDVRPLKAGYTDLLRAGFPAAPLP